MCVRYALASPKASTGQGPSVLVGVSVTLRPLGSIYDLAYKQDCKIGLPSPLPQPLLPPLTPHGPPSLPSSLSSLLYAFRTGTITD